MLRLILSVMLASFILISPAFPQVGSQDELCSIIQETRTKFVDHQNRFNQEANPLRKQELGSQFATISQDFDKRLDAYFKSSEMPFEGFVGTVTQVGAPTFWRYVVDVLLDCKQGKLVVISALFSTDQAADRGANDLNQWKQALMSINQSDRVQISGRFNFSFRPSYPRGNDKTFIYDRWDNDPNRPLVYAIYVAKLTKL